MVDFPFAILKFCVSHSDSHICLYWRWNNSHGAIGILGSQRQGATNLLPWWIHAWATPQIPLWKVRWDSPKSQWWQWHQPDEANKSKRVNFQDFPCILPFTCLKKACRVELPSANLSVCWSVSHLGHPFTQVPCPTLVPAPNSLKSLWCFFFGTWITNLCHIIVSQPD